MNKINYDREMQEIIRRLDFRPRLVLHSCCAPCSTRCIEELADYFDITVLYYNPNIDNSEEYAHRSAEQKRFLSLFRPEIKFLDDGYEPQEFEKMAKGREDLPEGGARCFECYRLRMEKAAKTCKNGDFFATTLTLSPLKNAEKINEIGYELAKKYNVSYLPTDFKKRNGYLRSIELSAEYNLYRQNYCGCKFSKNIPTNG